MNPVAKRLLVLFLPPAAALAAGLPALPETPAYVPAGVADRTGAMICVRTPESGLEAVEAATGRTLWKAPAPARAVLVARGSAFLLRAAEGGAQVELARLEATTGRTQARWPLPAAALSPGALGEGAAGRASTRFQSFARLSGPTLEVELLARTTVVSGFRGPSTEEARGVVSVNLDSGRMTVRPGAQLSRPALLEPVPAGAPPGLARFHARAGDDAIVQGGPPPDAPGLLVVGDLRISAERATGPDRVRLHRWRSGQRVPGPLVEIPAQADAIWSTLDRAHLALRRAREQAFTDVHELATGRRIATLERPVDIAALGGRVLWTRCQGNDQIELVASEAGSGRQLWRRTVFRAPPLGQPVP